MKYGGGMSSPLPVNAGVGWGCVLTSSLFNTCMDWILGRVVDKSRCEASVSNTNITFLLFANDVVIFTESLEVLVMALMADQGSKPFRLQVSWLKTKVQVFEGLLHETVQILICVARTLISGKTSHTLVAYITMVGHVKKSFSVMDSLITSFWHCCYLCRWTEIWIFKKLVVPVLLYGCETWTLSTKLKLLGAGRGPAWRLTGDSWEKNQSVLLRMPLIIDISMPS